LINPVKNAINGNINEGNDGLKAGVKYNEWTFVSERNNGKGGRDQQGEISASNITYAAARDVGGGVHWLRCGVMHNGYA
jgi:hypothetical protein